jgi:DUF4097 and DUF4098 domain-containing protein YvlB
MRKNYLVCAVAAAMLSVMPVSTKAADRDHDWDYQYTVKEEQTVRNSFPVTGSGKHRLVVDNIFGSVEVVGTSGNQVQMVVTETYRGETQQKVELAKKEVSLDTSTDDGTVRLYVNGPFRCNCNNGWGSNEHKGYVVKMDFKLEVPSNVELEVSTVNDGNITVKGMAGEFRVHNVNGNIDMTDVAAGGMAKTVNGHVKVSFRENPKANSEFSSINGEVALSFAQNLSADFRFKNFNGGIYTDYELTQLPAQAATEERKNGRFVYRADRFTGGRVGTGGPEIKVENLNGAIRILQRHV